MAGNAFCILTSEQCYLSPSHQSDVGFQDPNIPTQSKVNKGKGRVLVEDADVEMEERDELESENKESGMNEYYWTCALL